MAGIREVPTTATRFERIGSHTHVKGLGLDDDLKAARAKPTMWTPARRFLGQTAMF